MTERYPDRGGIAVSPLDIWLPESNLDLERKKNWNNHHTEFYARMYGAFILYWVFHDLAANQIYLPLDVHQWLHDEYDAAIMPTPYQAMDRIEQAFYEGEVLQVRSKGGYIQRPVDLAIVQMCDEDCNRLMGR